MKKNILLTVVVMFCLLVNAQNAIQEFNFNGTLSNTSNTISFLGDAKYVKDRTGTANGALRIVNNVLEATIPNLPVSNSKRTISIWVKYNDISTANYIWGYGSLINAQYFGLLQQSTTTSYSDLNLASFGPANDVIVSTTIASNTWYNYIVTYDGLTSKIYRNGELIKSSICSRKLTSSVVFGIGKMGSAISMKADIDDLKIYDVDLSAEEVAAMYNNSSVLLQNVTASAKATPKNGSEKITKKSVSAVTDTSVVQSVSADTFVKVSEIYSSQGLKVLSADKNEIDITTLPEGTYLLKISNFQDSASKKLTSN